MLFVMLSRIKQFYTKRNSCQYEPLHNVRGIILARNAFYIKQVYSNGIVISDERFQCQKSPFYDGELEIAKIVCLSKQRYCILSPELYIHHTV